MKTLIDLMNFFEGNVKCSKEEVQQWCVVGFHEGTIVCVEDEWGNIIGAATAYLSGPCTLFITMIYATSKKAMDHMIFHLQDRYPGYSMKAKRHGRIVEYNVEKLKTKILKLWKRNNT